MIRILTPPRAGASEKNLWSGMDRAPLMMMLMMMIMMMMMTIALMTIMTMLTMLMMVTITTTKKMKMRKSWEHECASNVRLMKFWENECAHDVRSKNPSPPHNLLITRRVVLSVNMLEDGQLRQPS